MGADGEACGMVGGSEVKVEVEVEWEVEVEECKNPQGYQARSEPHLL